MRSRVIVICLLAISVVLCGFQQGTTPKHRDAKQQSTNASQRNPKTDKQDTVATGQSASDPTDKNPNGIQGNNKQPIYIPAPEKSVDLIERIISIIGVVCTLALAVVGIAGICIALKTIREMKSQRRAMLGQLRAIRKQATEMSAQTDVLEKSVKAAQDSADAATKSAEIAARVAIPTLVIDEFEQANAGAANLESTIQFPNVRIVLKNYGQTPALLRSWNIIFTCEELAPVPDYWNQLGFPEVKAPAAGIVLEKDVIQPNLPYTIPDLHSWQRTEFSPEDIQAIIARKKTLWAYGFICYYDLFGSPLRRMKFCEMALNFWSGGVHWVSGFSPETYLGTDDYPFSQSATGNRAEGQTRSTNGKAI